MFIFIIFVIKLKRSLSSLLIWFKKLIARFVLATNTLKLCVISNSYNLSLLLDSTNLNEGSSTSLELNSEIEITGNRGIDKRPCILESEQNPKRFRPGKRETI